LHIVAADSISLTLSTCSALRVKRGEEEGLGEKGKEGGKRKDVSPSLDFSLIFEKGREVGRKERGRKRGKKGRGASAPRYHSWLW